MVQTTPLLTRVSANDDAFNPAHVLGRRQPQRMSCRRVTSSLLHQLDLHMTTSKQALSVLERAFRRAQARDNDTPRNDITDKAPR
jgi:DNA-nicking Smr family endonuclease